MRVMLPKVLNAGIEEGVYATENDCWWREYLPGRYYNLGKFRVPYNPTNSKDVFSE